MLFKLFPITQNGVPMHKPSFYGKMTLDQLKDVFKSCNDTEIPLIQERLESLHEASTVLNEVSIYIHWSRYGAYRKRKSVKKMAGKQTVSENTILNF